MTCGVQTDAEGQLSRTGMAPGRESPCLFVVGCQRSGTTLLQRMLDAHPMLAVGYDSHFIPRPVKRLPVGIDPLLTPEIVQDIRTFHRFARLGLPEAAVSEAAAAARTYGQFVRGLYSAFARLHGKPLAGEKSPGYVRHLPHLHALFPEAKIVHLIRDGRDVALSILDWGKGPAKLELFRAEPAAACALWWRRDVAVGRREGSALGPARYEEIRYEDLVADPEPAMVKLASFLELPFAPEMVHYHQGRTRPREGRSVKAAWLPPTTGLRDWRRQMKGRDLELFEALAGDLLEELGFPRGGEGTSPEVGRVADRCRAWWAEHVEGGKRREAGKDRTTAPRAARGRNPYVFLVGCPRSGTTLLKRMVDAHRQLAITPETHWIPRFYRKRIGVSGEGFVTGEFAARLLEYRKFANLRIAREDLERLLAAHPPLSYAEAASGIFDLYGRGQGVALVGDKTPGYVQHIPLLHGLWPQTRFVHLIRDGRDVCLSVLQWDRAARNVGRYRTWEEDRVGTIAMWWERLIRRGRDAGQTLGDDLYHEVRYERLIADPAATCEELCAFLDLPCDERMVHFHEGRTRAEPGMSAKRAWLPVTSGLRNWRAQMTEEDLERFEAVAGALLEELGYERGCPHPRPERVARAAALRDRFTKDPQYRQ